MKRSSTKAIEMNPAAVATSDARGDGSQDDREPQWMFGSAGNGERRAIAARPEFPCVAGALPLA
jgi:hypothetical protein